MSKKILILDDEQEYAVALRNFLVEFNYAVCVAISSSQALEAVKREKPDLVLFDYKLPDTDGDFFLRKAKELCPTAQYILVTAWNDPVILNRFKAMGVSEALLKPVDLEYVLNKVRGILKDKN